MSQPPEAMPAIDVRGLSKRFGSVLAVDELRFSVPMGSVTGFLGLNGAGKTTTLRMVLGLARPDGGDALVLGRPYAELERPLTLVGAALETTGFHPGRTARQHLRIQSMQGRIDPGRVDAVLDATGMSTFADTRVGGFSLGMRQRLAFASTLLGEPRVLILDEPANGMDPAGVAWLRGFLRRFAHNGGSVLVSSHVLSEVAEVVDEVVVIDRGSLVAHDSVERLIGERGASVVARTPDAERLLPVLREAGASVTARPDGSVEIRDLPIERVGELAAASNVVLHELRAESATLEQVFLAMTGNGDGASAGPDRPDAGKAGS